MRGHVRTAAISGVEAIPVDVEADVGPGLPCFTIVGLGDTAVQEARERVRSALKSSGFSFPVARVVLNLAPAPLRKRGTGFDLPIAAAILVATGQLESDVLDGATLVGELSLDGHLRSTAGVLVHAVMASRTGTRLLGPADGSGAARAVLGDRYVGLRGLSQLRDPDCPEAPPPPPVTQHETREVDLRAIAGQAHARRALEIAAAGGHHLLLEGPPGAGKTLLARALAGILPPLDAEERLTSALIHSVAGLDEGPPLAGVRPFRAPHHASTRAGLLGGGNPMRPGEACLAHNGVLFLDEMNEFAPSVLQTLRQPLESGHVTLVRADGVATFPASFSLVGAMNPCPCGYLGDSSGRCTCPPAVIERHRTRIGGPLRDRIDLQVRVNALAPRDLVVQGEWESSSTVHERVQNARTWARSAHRPASCNGGAVGLLDTLDFTPDASAALQRCAVRDQTSARGIARTARVARTIADLECSDSVQPDHIHEAFTFRGEER